MLKTFYQLVVLGVMLALIPFAAAQEETKPAIIRLKIFHDGQDRPTPAQITLSFDDQKLNIPIRNGRFEVPPQILLTKSDVGISTEIDHSRVDTEVPIESLADTYSWEISIADTRYGKDVDYAVPEGADLSKSCIIVFMPKSGGGWWMFDPHCRRKGD